MLATHLVFNNILQSSKYFSNHNIFSLLKHVFGEKNLLKFQIIYKYVQSILKSGENQQNRGNYESLKCFTK